MATLDLVIAEFVILAIVVGFLVRYYKSAMVTWDVTVTVYLAWVLGFVGILLLPLDVSIAVVEDGHSTMLDEVWRFVYWSTFLLAWIILPMQNEYHNSGHFGFGGKLFDAIKKLFLAGVAAILVAVIYIIIMVTTHSGSFSEVVGFMMACSNTYGVFVIIVLMGNGLVSLPRRLWQLADYESELLRLFISAGSVEAAFQDARYELEDCEADVEKAAEMFPESSRSPLAPYVAILRQEVANFHFTARSSTRKYVNSTPTTADVNTMAGLVTLHARVIQAQTKAGACDRRWKVLMKRCRMVQGLLDGSTQGPTAEASNWCEMKTEVSVGPNPPSLCHKISSCQYAIQNFYKTKLLKSCCRILSIICMAMSALILWSELMMSTSVPSAFGWLIGAYSHSSSHGNSVRAQAVTFIALAYMSICMYWSLFNLNLGWAFTLQGPQQSPPSSLIFNGEYFSRLQFSLGYNFLMILNAPRTSNTAFGSQMNNIALVPVFGTSFQVYVPLFMIIVALFTLFNVLPRLLAMVGIESEEPRSGVCRSRCCSRGGGGAQAAHQLLCPEDLEKYETGKRLVTAEMRSSSGASGSGVAGVLSPKILSPVPNPMTTGTKGAESTVPSSSRLYSKFHNLEDDDMDSSNNNNNNNSSSINSNSKLRSLIGAGTGRKGNSLMVEEQEDDEEVGYDFSKYLRGGGGGAKDNSASKGASGNSSNDKMKTMQTDSGSPAPSSSYVAAGASWLGKAVGFDKVSQIELPIFKSKIASPPVPSPSPPLPPPTESVLHTATSAVHSRQQQSQQHTQQQKDNNSKSFFDMMDDDDDDFKSGGRYS